MSRERVQQQWIPQALMLMLVGVLIATAIIAYGSHVGGPMWDQINR